MSIIVNETTFEKLELPSKLYKYRIWRKPEHKRMLTDVELYFAPPLDCDEQHECNLKRDYSLLTDQMIFDFSYRTAPKNLYNSEEERMALATRMIKESPVHDPQHREEMHTYFREKLNGILSIFCASEHKDNFSLWQTFGDQQEGFCVGLNPRKMFENQEIFGSGGKVQYYSLDNPPKIRPLCFTEEEHIEDMMKVIFSLPDKYAKEDEFRLSKMFLNNKQVKINPHAIEEIILGAEMGSEHKEEIIAVVKKILPHAEVLQAACDYDLGFYSFTKIDT